MLTKEEKKVVSSFRKLLSSHSKKNPIKAYKISEKLGIDDIAIRKLTHYLRTTGRVPIIATNQGYYISYSKKEITNQINSLKERAYSIFIASSGLKKFL
jgi:biotin operon repressor